MYLYFVFCIFLFLFIYLFICLFVYFFIYLSIYLFIFFFDKVVIQQLVVIQTVRKVIIQIQFKALKMEVNSYTNTVTRTC